MQITSTPPEAFPGKEFSLQWGEEYIYEQNRLRLAHTTGSDETLVIPDIWYRALAIADWGPTPQYFDGAEPKIGELVLDESQKQAIERAKSIEARREQEDPTLDNFVSMRQADVDNNGQLYLCVPQEGGALQSKRPLAAVRKAEKLGIIDFATATLGYHGFFKFNARDIEEFIPAEWAGRANAYVMIDEPRVVVGVNGEHDYQIVKLLLLDAQSDLDFPLGLLDRKVKIIMVAEDGSETVGVHDPDAEETLPRF